jgi:hypothetical protein
MSARSSERFSSKLAVILFASGGLMMFDGLAAADPPKEKYVFFENTDRWVGIVIGDSQLIGKLDKNGELIHEYKLRAGQPSSGLPPYGIINATGSMTKPKKVYEYRSEMLIPGELRSDGRFAVGRFVPEAGGKIIAFKDYEYTPTATPIWNLPGVFVTEAEAARLKQPKPPDQK